MWPNFKLIIGYTPILDSRSQTSAIKDRDLDRARHIPDSGELLIRHHHMMNKTGTAGTHNRSGMEVYQDGAVTIGVGVGIILLCVTNIVSNIYRNNAI